MSLRRSPWPAGVPCWADVMTPDVEAASRFYSSVLGWSVEPPDERYGGYVIATMRAAPAAGIGPIQQAGAPAAWTMYFAADDVDAVAARVPELGGSLLVPPGDVAPGDAAGGDAGPPGRMCVAADPSGAVFGVWQAGSHIGAGIANEHGALTWDDLRSTDPDAARAFYADLFGFRTDPLPDAGPDYALFTLPGESAPLGGMGGMMGAPEGTPSHWLVYFAVPDAAAAASAAEAGGGTVLMRDFASPYGTIAMLADPAGATFLVIQPPEGAPQPDRSG